MNIFSLVLLIAILSCQHQVLVKMIRNELYEDGYPWFRLRNNDGAGDEIVDIEWKDGKYLLKIKRTFQEGGANLLIAVYKNKSNDLLEETLENKHTEE